LNDPGQTRSRQADRGRGLFRYAPQPVRVVHLALAFKVDGRRASQDELDSRRYAQLRIGSSYVRFNGASANVEVPGMCPGGPSLGHKLRRLAFSFCQPLQLVVQRAELGPG